MTNVFKISSVAVALSALVAGPAAAEMKYDNGSGGSVLLYGQLSPAYVWVDDGVSTYSNLVDNGHSNSRVGLWVTQPVGQDTFTFNFETALGLRQSFAVSQNFTPKGVNWSRTFLRKIDFAYNSDQYGKVSFGLGSMATDGIAESDFGGTGMALYNGIGDAAGAFRFQPVSGIGATVPIGTVTASLDGGRRGRVRYDTPEFNGFRVAVAAGTEVLLANDDDFYDIALRYRTDVGTAKFKGGFGWSRRVRNGVNRDNTVGSMALELQSGLNFAVAAGNRHGGGDYTYGKIGYNANWISAGQTSLGIDYYDGNDFLVGGSSSGAMGIAIQQKIDRINTEVYMGYRTYELNDTATVYHDIDSLIVGARWKF
ncbi:porin [Aliisedimentitalea scapharcae]|uniref:Porin n=1 Tax=Aliisedimentitalea scapharcae TaxID=1524259 RepID=A0ABZ2XXA7_9RHOB